MLATPLADPFPLSNKVKYFCLLFCTQSIFSYTLFFIFISGTETLEDLMTTLSQQINDSDWLQLNTAEKFAAENPEVAKAFRDATLKSLQDGGVSGDS